MKRGTVWVFLSLLCTLLIACDPKKVVPSDGLYQGSGTSFREAIIIKENVSRFEHTISRDGAIIFTESGSASVNNDNSTVSNIRLKPFTNFVDWENGPLRPDSQRFIYLDMFVVSNGTFEMLKPFLDYDYYLRKQQ
jgi:hypothetical protein